VGFEGDQRLPRRESCLTRLPNPDINARLVRAFFLSAQFAERHRVDGIHPARTGFLPGFRAFVACAKTPVSRSLEWRGKFNNRKQRCLVQPQLIVSPIDVKGT
jgi:hypothetical protein